MAATAGGKMPATKTKRHVASKDPFAQFRGSVDGLAQQLRNRRAQGWDAGTFEQIAHEIERLQIVAAQFDPRWVSLLAQMHGPISAARVAQRMPDAGATAQLMSTAEHLLLQLPTAGTPGDDSPELLAPLERGRAAGRCAGRIADACRAARGHAAESRSAAAARRR